MRNLLKLESLGGRGCKGDCWVSWQESKQPSSSAQPLPPPPELKQEPQPPPPPAFSFENPAPLRPKPEQPASPVVPNATPPEPAPLLKPAAKKGVQPIQPAKKAQARPSSVCAYATAFQSLSQNETCSVRNCNPTKSAPLATVSESDLCERFVVICRSKCKRRRGSGRAPYQQHLCSFCCLQLLGGWLTRRSKRRRKPPEC